MLFRGKFTVGFTAVFTIKKNGDKKVLITAVNGKLSFATLTSTSPRMCDRLFIYICMYLINVCITCILSAISVITMIDGSLRMNKCSDRTTEVQFSDLLGNMTDGPTDQPSDRQTNQPTEMSGHR